MSITFARAAIRNTRSTSLCEANRIHYQTGYRCSVFHKSPIVTPNLRLRGLLFPHFLAVWQQYLAHGGHRMHSVQHRTFVAADNLIDQTLDQAS